VFERVETNPGQGGAPLTLDKLPSQEYVQPVKIMLAAEGATGPTVNAADPMPVTGTALTATATGVGAPADAVATTDTGAFSLVAFFKRALQNWTTLLARTTPGQAVAASSLPVVIASNQTAVPVSGAVTVSGTVTATGAFFQATQPVSAVALPLPAGASTSALQTTGNTSLANLDAKLGALALGGAPVTPSAVPRLTSVTNASVATSGTGATFVPLASAACNAVEFINTAPAAVDIEYRRGGAGVAINIPAGASFPVLGVTNANQLDIRRVDQSNTPQTVYYHVWVQ
jgi:hypothetical protein